MSPVNDVGVSTKLGNLDHEYVELAKANDEVGRRIIRINTLVDEIRTDIKGGRSTGNPINDFVVCKFDYPDWGKKKSNLDALQDLIRGKGGELVLVVHRYTDKYEGGCCGDVRYMAIAPPHGPSPRNNIYLGRLIAENLVVDLEHSAIKLPTECYVEHSGFQGKTRKVEGQIAGPDYFSFFNLAFYEPKKEGKEGDEWPEKYASMGEEDFCVTLLNHYLTHVDDQIIVIAGDDEVSAFFPGRTREVFNGLTLALAESVTSS